MKCRIFKVASLVILSILIIGIPVLASGYTSTIQVVNSSTALTYPPVIVPQDNAYLSAQGYIASDGLDVQVKDNGVAMPLMLTDKQTLFVPDSLAATSTSNFDWSSGNTPVSNDQIIVGEGGYLTTPYNVTLEPGSDFEIDISGYINTTLNTGNEYILYKPGAITIQLTNDGEITATVTDAGGDNTLILTGIASGINTLSLSLISGTLTFAVGANSDTLGSVGAVVNPTNDWVWNQDVVMPYINYIKMYRPSTTTNSVVVYDKNTLAQGIWVNLPAGYQPLANSMCLDVTYLYVLAEDVSSSFNVSIFKIDRTTLNIVDQLDYSYHYGYGSSDYSRLMTIIGGNLFVVEPNDGNLSTVGNIDKVQTYDMTVIDVSDPIVNALSIDTDGTYIYILIAGSDPTWIFKMVGYNLSIVDSSYLAFDHTSYYSIGGSIVCDTSVVYVRGRHSNNLSLCDLTTVSTSGLNRLDYVSDYASGGNPIRTPLDYQSGKLFAYYEGTSGVGIDKFNASVPMNLEDDWNSSGLSGYESNSICSDTSYIYVASVSDLWKINIGTMVTDSSISLNNNVASNILISGNNLYVTDEMPDIYLWYQPDAILVSGSSADTGTATFTISSATVVGGGTSWTTNMAGGQIKLDADATYYTIKSVESATSLTLTSAYTQAGGNGAYTLNYYPTATLPDLTGTEDGVITLGANIATSGAGAYDIVVIPIITGFAPVGTNPDGSYTYGQYTTQNPDQAPIPVNQGGQITNYVDGTASFTNGSTTVTGSGTTWQSMMAGGYIKLDSDGTYVSIASVQSATELTLNSAYSYTGGNGTYAMQYLSGGQGSEDTLQSNNIFTPWFQPWADVSNIPVITFFLFIGTALLMLAVVWILKHTQNQLIGAFVLVMGEALLYKVGIYQLWFVIVSAIICASLIIFERKPSL